jgi:hypothetical protein
VFALAVLAMSVLATGCDGESSFVIPPGDAGAPGSRYAVACSAWARRYCAILAGCPSVYPAWADGQCVPRMTLECEVVASDPDVAFDPVAVATCPDSEAGCPGLVRDLCLGPGRARVGAPCLVSEACETRACEYTYDELGRRSSCGVCAPVPCGGACPTGQACTVGLDGGASCVRVAAAGEPCTAADDCADFYCAPATKRCGARAQPGEPCDGMNGPPCADPDTFCDATAHCRRYVLEAYGEPCDTQGPDHYLCAGMGTCDFTDNVCVPPAADGQYCDDTQGLNCLDPARCIANRCVFPSLARCGAQ